MPPDHDLINPMSLSANEARSIDEKNRSDDEDMDKKDLDGYGGEGKSRVLVTDTSDMDAREREVEELEERIKNGEATTDEYRVNDSHDVAIKVSVMMLE